MINPAMIFRLKNSWEKFTASHPKFPMFLQAAVNNNVLREGTILEINITKYKSSNDRLHEQERDILFLLQAKP